MRKVLISIAVLGVVVFSVFILYTRSTVQLTDTSKLQKSVRIVPQQSPTSAPDLKVLTVSYVQLNDVTLFTQGGMDALKLEYSFLDGDKSRKFIVQTSAFFSLSINEKETVVTPKEALSLLQKGSVQSLVFMYVDKARSVDYTKLCGSLGESCVKSFATFGGTGFENETLKSKILNGNAELTTNDVWLFSVTELAVGRD